MNTIHTSCAACGVEFCLPGPLHAARQRDGKRFYCPNGHPLSYKPTEAEKRIAELEKKVDNRDLQLEWLGAELDETLAQREELIGMLKECPGRCGWRSRRQIPRDPVAMGRGIERVRQDIAEHLMAEHGCRPIEAVRLLEAGS